MLFCVLLLAIPNLRLNVVYFTSLASFYYRAGLVLKFPQLFLPRIWSCYCWLRRDGVKTTSWRSVRLFPRSCTLSIAQLCNGTGSLIIFSVSSHGRALSLTLFAFFNRIFFRVTPLIRHDRAMWLAISLELSINSSLARHTL